ncbi:MAG: VWA domain-containing protein [Vicinamibacterales bacterium]|nr:VWA domain-containing protein [Vicinamibacterales bacterium]
MTFGLLSAGQMALVAALAGAAVVAIFFLKVRHPLVVVPSLVLWQRVLDEHRRDSLIERLRRLLSLLLALAIAWLLAVAAAEPRPDGASGGRLALIVDNGPTMHALTGGGTRLDRAKAAARTLITQAGGDARFQVVDTSGAVRTPPDLDRQQAVDAVDRIRPGAGDRRTPATAEGYAPVIFTDAPQEGLPEGARVVSLFERVSNVGITAFEVRATPARPSEHTAYLSIVNFDAEAREVAITIGAPGRTRVQRTVPLAAGAAFRQVLPMNELDPGVVEARISTAGDRFPADDVAFGWLPDPRPWRVALITTGQPALAAVIGSDPGVVLEIVAPDDYRPAIDADLLVFDRFVPETAPETPALLIGPAPSAWLPLAEATRTLPTVVASGTEHPLMAAVALDDLHVTRTAVIAAEGAVPLAADAGHTVIAAGSAAAPWVAIGFALDDSNFATQPAFPIFIANTLAWFRGEADPIIATPGLIEVPRAGAMITTLDGQRVPSTSALGASRFTADGPGVFFATARGVRVPVLVNLAQAGWTPAAPDGAADAGAGELPATSRPWWTLMAMAVLLLLAVEWFTWQRRITV